MCYVKIMNETPNTSYIISANLNGKRWACAMRNDDGTVEALEHAKDIARAHRDGGWKEVKLARTSDPAAIEKAEFQIYKVEDWASDYEAY